MGRHSIWLTACYDSPSSGSCFLAPIELLHVLCFNLVAVVGIWLELWSSCPASAVLFLPLGVGSRRRPDSCKGWRRCCWLGVWNIPMFKKTKLFNPHVVLRKQVVHCTAAGIIINMNIWVLDLKQKAHPFSLQNFFTCLLVCSVDLSLSCCAKKYNEVHGKVSVAYPWTTFCLKRAAFCPKSYYMLKLLWLEMHQKLFGLRWSLKKNHTSILKSSPYSP